MSFKMPRTWKPAPVEEYFGEGSELLLMWNALKATEEKRVPWYADEPIAKSELVDMEGIFRTNFDPRGNFYHLVKVAEAVGIESLPVRHKEAYEFVLKYLKDERIQGSSDKV